MSPALADGVHEGEDTPGCRGSPHSLYPRKERDRGVRLRAIRGGLGPRLAVQDAKRGLA
jgi:hypothetical protein